MNTRDSLQSACENDVNFVVQMGMNELVRREVE